MQPAIHHLLASSHTALGALGEAWAREIFEQAGFRVDPDHTLGDMNVIHPKTGQIFTIEVKTARANKDGKWRFNLQKKGHCSHKKADYLLCLPVTRSGQIIPYLLPVGAVWNIHCLGMCNPRTYSGKYARYRLTNPRKVLQ